MKPIFGLIENNRLRRVDNIICDLMASVCRKTVQKNRIGMGLGHQIPVDLEGRKDLDSFFFFCLLSHRCPGVGIDGMGVLDRLGRIITDFEAEARILTILLGLFDDVGIGFVSWWGGHLHKRSSFGRRKEQAVTDIVPISNVGEAEVGQIVMLFLDGQKISHPLTWMQQIGQRIDDRSPCVFGQILGDLMIKCADHDYIDPAFEVFSHVVRAFSLSQLDVGGAEIDGLAAQLEHPDLKSHPCPK